MTSVTVLPGTHRAALPGCRGLRAVTRGGLWRRAAALVPDDRRPRRPATRPRSPTATSKAALTAYPRCQSRSPDPVDAIHNAVIWAHSTARDARRGDDFPGRGRSSLPMAVDK